MHGLVERPPKLLSGVIWSHYCRARDPREGKTGTCERATGYLQPLIGLLAELRFVRETSVTSWSKFSDIVKFDIFTAVTMKNVVFLDIKPLFVLHRRHITSPLQSPAS
jgi:hypothetical protein